MSKRTTRNPLTTKRTFRIFNGPFWTALCFRIGLPGATALLCSSKSICLALGPKNRDKWMSALDERYPKASTLQVPDKFSNENAFMMYALTVDAREYTRTCYQQNRTNSFAVDPGAYGKRGNAILAAPPVGAFVRIQPWNPFEWDLQLAIVHKREINAKGIVKALTVISKWGYLRFVILRQQWRCHLTNSNQDLVLHPYKDLRRAAVTDHDVYNTGRCPVILPGTLCTVREKLSEGDMGMQTCRALNFKVTSAPRHGHVLLRLMQCAGYTAPNDRQLLAATDTLFAVDRKHACAGCKQKESTSVVLHAYYRPANLFQMDGSANAWKLCCEAVDNLNEIDAEIDTWPSKCFLGPTSDLRIEFHRHESAHGVQQFDYGYPV